jgi:SAM-dependent methyltransferase
MKHQHSILLLYVFCAAGHLFAQETDSVRAGLEKERNRWNKSLTRDTAYKFNKQPNALLMDAIKNRKPGKALDVGMGQGRNSIYMAQQGWSVTGFDIADEAVASAKTRAEKENVKINTILEPIETFDFGVSQWDLIAYVYEGCMEKEVLEKIKISLKHGGIVVFEFFHREAGIKMKRPDFGCETNSIKNLFMKMGGFTIVRYEEVEGVADYSLRKYQLVKLVAERK